MANNATRNLLPQKSAKLYDKQYKRFMSWCEEHSVQNYTENVLLGYFSERATTYNSASLWSLYSMIKSTLVIRNNVDISKFPKLIAFIKSKNAGYKPKKSNIFTREEINKFLLEAPDHTYLMWKVSYRLDISITINLFLSIYQVDTYTWVIYFLDMFNDCYCRSL